MHQKLLAALFALLVLGSTTFSQSLTYVSAPNKTQWIEPNKPIGRTLRADETHQYVASLGKGQYFDATISQRGINVIVQLFGPRGNKVAEFNSSMEDQGDEPVTFEAKTAGRYRVEISSSEKDVPTGYYAITLNEIATAQVYAARVAEKLRQQKAVISKLKTNAIPLKTIEAGYDFTDLQPLKKTFDGVRFVGLGEETHGTREFFQVKHRLLEFLVEEMGFRVLAMEASYAAMQLINEYVMGNTDDGTSALNDQGFWHLNTEEVRAMMEWARTYNASVSVAEQVKFVGFDSQYNQPGKDKLLTYLKRVAPERVPTTEAFFQTNLDSLNSTISQPDQLKVMQDSLQSLRANYADLQRFLATAKINLVAKSSQAEHEQMSEYLRVLMQSIDAYAQQDTAGNAPRDHYMADNFRHLVDREPAGTRFVIWAHNGHVATGNNGFFKPMGAYLRQVYDRTYYSLGFSFNQGSFQARDAQPKQLEQRMLRSFSVPPALPGSVDWYLARTWLKAFIIDFRATPKDTDLNNWLTNPVMMRSIGSVCSLGADHNFFYPIELGQRFDGLLFIDQTTRARPNPSVKNVARRNEE